MKKKVLSIVLVLSMVFTLVPVLNTTVNAVPASWQNAYAAFLKDRENGCDAFSLRDIDKNGVPELLVRMGAHALVTVFTYTNKVTELDGLNSNSVSTSENKDFPGLFIDGMDIDTEIAWTNYVTLKNGKITQTKVSITDTKVTPQKDTVYNKTLYALEKSAKELPFYSVIGNHFDNTKSFSYVENFNITDVIVNYGKNPANQHPYVAALRAYYKYLTQLHNKTSDGTTTNLSSYLVDINGDGTNEMLAVDAKYKARLFYLSSGKLCSYDLPILNESLGFSANNRIVITHSFYGGVASSIYTIKNGKATSDVLAKNSDDNGNFTGYEHNNKKISEATYKSLTKTYGLANGLTSVYKRPDQTDQILAMKNSVK